jgi:hypothetical protein
LLGSLIAFARLFGRTSSLFDYYGERPERNQLLAVAVNSCWDALNLNSESKEKVKRRQRSREPEEDVESEEASWL